MGHRTLQQMAALQRPQIQMHHLRVSLTGQLTQSENVLGQTDLTVELYLPPFECFHSQQSRNVSDPEISLGLEMGNWQY